MTTRLKHGVKLLALVLFLTSACAPAVSYRAHPSLPVQAQRIRTVALLPPEVKVYQIDAGGIREEFAEWSDQARKNIISALESELRARTGMALKVVAEESLGQEKARLKNTRALFDAVGTSILLHTYHPSRNYIFEEKLTNFDYSLGSEVSNLTKEGEAQLLLIGNDHVWTGGRQALQAMGVLLGIGAGVATGVVIIPRLGGGTSLSAALVNSSTGEILWFNTTASGGGKDLRDPASAMTVVQELFKDFPIGHGPKPSEEKSE